MESEISQISNSHGNNVVDPSNDDKVIELVIRQKWVGVTFPVKCWGGRKFLQYKKCVLMKLKVNLLISASCFLVLVIFLFSHDNLLYGRWNKLYVVFDFWFSVSDQHNIMICCASVLKRVFYAYGVHWKKSRLRVEAFLFITGFT